jgi:cytochrome c oxidase cbb3-type subunit 3
MIILREGNNMLKQKSNIIKMLIFLLPFFGLIFNTINCFSQTTSQTNDQMTGYSQAIGLFILLLVLLIFIVLIVYSEKKYRFKPGMKDKRATAPGKLRQFLTRSVPVEQEEDIMFDHNFDGIRELDNRIPPWYNYLFYATIVFGVIYMLHFHVFGGKLMIDEYVDEIQAADLQRQELIRTGALINEDNVSALTDEQSIKNGKDIFTVNCVPCHGPDGGGTVGPNLADDYWIHGGGIKNIFKTIKYGVPVKGMIAWQTQLTPKKIQEVSSFILTLKGTTPLTPKAPEGQLYQDTGTVKTLVKDSLKTGTTKTGIKSDSLKKK